MPVEGGAVMGSSTALTGPRALEGLPRRGFGGRGHGPHDRGNPHGTKRRHDQYCPIARAVDLVGDRWTLLILRELLFGEQRFVDLRKRLSGISSSVLSDRLRMLIAAGLVGTRDLPPPVGRTVYVATSKAREARPILQAMSRFGMAFLAPAGPSTKVRPEIAAHFAVESWFEPAVAVGLDEIYRLVLDGAEFTLASVLDAKHGARGRTPDLVLTAPSRVIMAARRGDKPLAHALASGAATFTGSKRALHNFQRVFRLP